MPAAPVLQTCPAFYFLPDFMLCCCCQRGFVNWLGCQFSAASCVSLSVDVAAVQIIQMFAILQLQLAIGAWPRRDEWALLPSPAGAASKASLCWHQKRCCMLLFLGIRPSTFYSPVSRVPCLFLPDWQSVCVQKKGWQSVSAAAHHLHCCASSVSACTASAEAAGVVKGYVPWLPCRLACILCCRVFSRHRCAALPFTWLGQVVRRAVKRSRGLHVCGGSVSNTARLPPPVVATTTVVVAGQARAEIVNCSSAFISQLQD